MPVKHKGSITTKLIGFAIVIAVVVLAAKHQRPITNQKTTEQIQRTQFLTRKVPVDRSLLSQQLLPMQSNFNSIDTTENTFYVDTSQESETYAGSYETGALQSSTDYELKLDDQKAWGSRTRRASLVSAKRQPEILTEKVAVASSQSPIVPGLEDPHRWIESQYVQLATDLESQQKEQPIPREQIEFSELPTLFPENTLSKISRPKARSVGARSLEVVPAPRVRMARAWETGRY